MTQVATIRPNGFGRFYVNLGVTRIRRDFKTVAGAVRAAEKREGVTEVVIDPCCDRTLVSVAREVMLDGQGYEVTIDGVKIYSEDLDAFNAALVKLGRRPVRFTSNMLNRAAGAICIDADTSIGCDPGSETYWSM